MKVVHLDKATVKPLTGEEWFRMGTDSEKKGDVAEAIAAYQGMVRKNYRVEFAYNRLATIYRNQKMYDKELAVIKSAIKALESLFAKRNMKHDKRILAISKRIMRSTGLADNRGKELYKPEPLRKWLRREKSLLRKMNSK